MSGAYGGGRLSRDDYRKQKELEAARKAGTAPAELDEDGNEINPHIPTFMSQAPWYISTGKTGLQHQRKWQKEQPTTIGDTKWYRRGERMGTAPTKFRKGACENCGAQSHRTKDCMDRPRKKGARWTGKDMQADEAVDQIDLSYDAKRDMWNGYDGREHQRLMQEWDLVEEARRKRKASELDDARAKAKEKEGAAPASIEEQLDSSDEDEGAGPEDATASGKSKSTVRNLRIREDTAKYLRNLDPESAFYDPKTRSMRENPYAGKKTDEDGATTQPAYYAGDNFIRYSNEVQEIRKREVFAWEAGERGNSSAHFQANPTQTALMYGEFVDKRDTIKNSRQQALVEQYGGQEHLEAPAPELMRPEERYVEYSRTGQVVAGDIQPVARSRYREDMRRLNHTEVFGSWWSDGHWGYACCKQMMKNAYCTKPTE
ncbi:mRNA splicing protein [Coemansia sp. RSA 1365]|nr:mRNA splicing protein [Coemansia sp. RSA 1365]